MAASSQSQNVENADSVAADLEELGVTFQDVVLLNDRLGSDCSLEGHSTLCTLPDLSWSTPGPRFQFRGTRGMAALSGRVYWQVKLRVPAQASIPADITICEIGVASQRTLLNSVHGITPTEANALTVHLCLQGSRLKALSFFKEMELDEIDLDSYDDAVGLDRTLGLLQDIPAKRLVVVDVFSEKKLCDHPVDRSQPLYPVVSFRIGCGHTRTRITLTVESGQQLTRSSDLVNLLRNMLEEGMEVEELEDEQILVENVQALATQ